jgi:hypothetical protein
MDTKVINSKIKKKSLLLKKLFKDLSERWLEDFEEENFEQMYDKLFEEIKPLYQLLHTYVKNKLDLIYGSKYPANHNSSLIQAHLLGLKLFIETKK